MTVLLRPATHNQQNFREKAMSQKQPTKKGTPKGSVGSKGKQSAAQHRAADALTAERIRAILTDPKVKRGVKSKLEELTYKLYSQTNAFSEAMPDSCAADFINGTDALREQPRNASTRAVRDEIVRLAEEHEPEAYKVARRCREIYNAWLTRKGGRKYAEGAYHFSEHVDAVMESGENLLCGINSKYFVPLFVEAVRDPGKYGRGHYGRLLDLIARVDAGADLNALHDEAKRDRAASAEAYKSEELSKPEPKDKTSDEWRYWKLRQIEAGFASDDVEKYREAWREFWQFFDGYKLDRADTGSVRELLPTLIIAYQGQLEYERQERAGIKGGKTRSANKAKGE